MITSLNDIINRLNAANTWNPSLVFLWLRLLSVFWDTVLCTRRRSTLGRGRFYSVRRPARIQTKRKYRLIGIVIAVFRYGTEAWNKINDHALIEWKRITSIWLFVEFKTLVIISLWPFFISTMRSKNRWRHRNDGKYIINSLKRLLTCKNKHRSSFLCKL